MGASCKTACNRSGDGTDEAGMEPPLLVHEPDLTIPTEMDGTMEGTSKCADAVIEDSQAAPDTETDVARIVEAQGGSSPPLQEMEDDTARQSEDTKVTAPEVTPPEVTAPEATAPEVTAPEATAPEEGTQPVALDSERKAAEDVKAPIEHSELPQEEHTDAPEKPAAKPAAKKAPKRKAAAKAKQKKKVDDDAATKRVDDSSKKDTSESDTGKAPSGDKAKKTSNVDGWGSVDKLQQMFAEELENEKKEAEDLMQQYLDAVKINTTGVAKNGAMTKEEKLALYGLYKQISEGDNPKAKPGMMTGMEARAKWSAWHSRKGMDKKDAMEEYVKLSGAAKTKYNIELPS